MRSGQPPGGQWPTIGGCLTRARIAGAAADLFAEHGIAGTSVEDISAAAGTSGSQITHYFDSKQCLARAMIPYTPMSRSSTSGTSGPRLSGSWPTSAPGRERPRRHRLRPAGWTRLRANCSGQIRGRRRSSPSLSLGGLRQCGEPSRNCATRAACARMPTRSTCPCSQACTPEDSLPAPQGTGASWRWATDTMLACITPAWSGDPPPVPGHGSPRIRHKVPRAQAAALLLRTRIHPRPCPIMGGHLMSHGPAGEDGWAGRPTRRVHSVHG
jgi:hypothetical protein